MSNKGFEREISQQEIGEKLDDIVEQLEYLKYLKRLDKIQELIDKIERWLEKYGDEPWAGDE